MNQIAKTETIEEFLKRTAETSLLRFSTCGSVDDGKSTLIGRLLHDSKNIYEDQFQALPEEASGNHAKDLALLTDGLRAEREQGITIDVAYRYFSTPKRHFILADTPGHEQYTRNMATGASTANLAILLIDARNGVVTQSKRHAFIASLLGIPRIVVTVNKMDLKDFSEEVFEKIKDDFTNFSAKLGFKEIRFIPVSALLGDNVVEPSKNMPWYRGETVMEYLENVYIAGDTNLVDFRFPVQYVIRPNQNYRGYTGQVVSGVIGVGEEVVVLPSLQRSKIAAIDTFSGKMDSAFAPDSVTLTLTDELDISRGDMIVRANNMPKIQSNFEAMVVWMSEEELNLKQAYILRHTTNETKAFVDSVSYKVDVNTLSRLEATPLALNEIGRLTFTVTTPIFIDPYEKNRATGSFILVNPHNYRTVAAGMIIERLPQEFLATKKQSLKTPQISQNIHAEESAVTRQLREAKIGHRAMTLWLTGLSGSGKSSIAREMEKKLFENDIPVYRLDGDNLRYGLNRDLGFSRKDRAENIRRTAEVARLFNQAGITVICSLISPMQKDRDAARAIVGSEYFCEVFISTALEVCESRDPHGLYQKARAGEIREFTGISSPYEVPLTPYLTIDAGELSLEESVDILFRKWLEASVV
ncbi:MAG: sulfate adenylyltransferase subunit CysN [Bdellovibrionota bacterium]|jgi:bifunctional enzyme CysN/CysC